MRRGKLELLCGSAASRPNMKGESPLCQSDCSPCQGSFCCRSRSCDIVVPSAFIAVDPKWAKVAKLAALLPNEDGSRPLFLSFVRRQAASWTACCCEAPAGGRQRAARRRPGEEPRRPPPPPPGACGATVTTTAPPTPPTAPAGRAPPACSTT